MALFGKSRTSDPGAGLGRGVVDASDAVIDAEAPVVADKRSEEAAGIVEEVSAPAKPTRAERKAAAAAAKAQAKADKASGVTTTAVVDPSAPKKSRKAQKAEKDAMEAEQANVRLSNMVMIDFYPGMAKEDAIETARHWAMTHMDLPSLCSYYVTKIRDGYAIEVQEGVGRAYLPSVIELAQSNPGRLIIVPMIRRKMTVFYSSRLGEFEAQILPELQDPPAMPENPPIQAVRGPSMTPIMKQYREWLVTGAATAAIGGLALLSSLAFYAFDPKAKVPPEWRTTDIAQLPVMQWGRLQADATDSYVTRLEFQDGNWRVVRQAVGSTVDVATPDATNSGGEIVGGVVPNAADGAIPPPGAPGATTAVPGGAPGAVPPSPQPSPGSPTIPPPSGLPSNR